MSDTRHITLNERIDFVIDGKHLYSATNGDAIPIFIHSESGEVSVGGFGMSHYDSMQDYNIEVEPEYDLVIARYWQKPSVLGFDIVKPTRSLVDMALKGLAEKGHVKVDTSRLRIVIDETEPHREGYAMVDHHLVIYSDFIKGDLSNKYKEPEHYKKSYALHLADPETKRNDADMGGYLNNRSQNQGRTFATQNGGEMSRAEWNALHRTSESTGKPNKMKITESKLYQLVRENISRALNERWETIKGTPMTERETPPTITLKAYKQVRLTNQTKKDGKVYPLYVDRGSGWKIGTWYNAGIGDYQIQLDDKTNKPTGKVKVKSKLGGLSFRPGLHFGSIPYAPHIFTKKPNFEDERLPQNLDKKGKLRKDYDFTQTRMQKHDVVWAECEISFDKDYQQEANAKGSYVNKKGKTILNKRNACLQTLPTDGAYKYQTNSNAPAWETWYIAGAFKINRILSDEEVKDICARNNVVSLERDGILDLTSYFPNN